jgi:ATP dependent DNA ligase domain.
MSIFSEYKDFKYIYPPRPDAAISPDLLKNMGPGWIAQPKYNGSCAVLFINGHRDYKIYNRKGEILTLQRPINYTSLNDGNKYMVLCGEYLNKSKNGEDGKPFNHKFVIWDILVWNGRYLIGETCENRLNILHQLFGTSRAHVSGTGMLMFNHLHTTHVEDVFMAPSYLRDFKALYDEIVETDLYEGLVLKKATAKLELGFREMNNTGWQVKARKTTKNYNF